MESFLIYVTPHYCVTFIELTLWLDIVCVLHRTLKISNFFFWEIVRLIIKLTLNGNNFPLWHDRHSLMPYIYFLFSDSFIYLFIHSRWLIMNQQLYTKKRERKNIHVVMSLLLAYLRGSHYNRHHQCRAFYWFSDCCCCCLWFNFTFLFMFANRIDRPSEWALSEGLWALFKQIKNFFAVHFKPFSWRTTTSLCAFAGLVFNVRYRIK